MVGLFTGIVVNKLVPCKQSSVLSKTMTAYKMAHQIEIMSMAGPT